MMQHGFSPDQTFNDPDLLLLLKEQREANAGLRAQAATMRPPGIIDAPTLRRMRLYNGDGSYKPPQVATAYDDSITTRSGDVPIRTFSVNQPRGLIVHFHGGGWALGSVHEQDGHLATLAAQTGGLVVSVDYPLAPEHRLPQALEVAYHALKALMLRDGDISVAIVGESAGAHVALQSVLRLDAALRCRIRALSLAYGIYDLSMTPSQRRWGNEFLGLSTAWLEWFYSLTLPGYSREERRDPSYSPLYAKLTDLPPTLITVGELDPLLDDSLFLFQRLRAAHNIAQLVVFPEAPHGFNHQSTAMADRCNAIIAAFLATRLFSEDE